MELTKSKKDLCFEFCKYISQNNDFKYCECLIDRKDAYVINVFVSIDDILIVKYFFFFDENNEIIKVFKNKVFYINTLITEMTNEWIRFLRKKKLEKLRANGTN